ncbi:hypothetical protein V7O66_09385 [Methanolobus sp. ZRKC3]|uniref:hypothetical protein n=1 Tax=Methanolobus sp. ZRKC3 TaxID=3125786 RepID=UPI003251C5BE
MGRKTLESEPTMQQLYALTSPAAQTWASYLSAMVHYTECCGKTPTELISSARADI